MSTSGSFAGRLRELRLSADLTLEGLAERSGVSVRTLSDIERGVSATPQRRTVEAILDGLGLEPRERAAVLREVRARRAASAQTRESSAVAPHRVSDFTGRQRELVEILALLARTSTEDPSPVVICGPPGVGKTSSALEATHRIAAGRPILVVDLAGLSPVPLSPLHVIRALLRQLPGAEAKVPANLEAATALWRSTVAERPVTVLLDNAANESQVRPVLTADARTAVVVTSRRTLAGLEGVRRMTLGPLSHEESVALLAKLIPAAQREAGDLRELAELADHMPLAMRIAGNRIASRPGQSAADFIDRLRTSENRLRLLVAGDLAVEAAFALSYDDLEPDTAALFRSISVIDVGTFDARAAAATLDHDDADVDLRLDDLVDLGLVEARGGNRYQLHDLVRLFAHGRLRTIEGDEAVERRRARLRAWLLGTLERAGAWCEPGRTPTEPGAAGIAFPDAESADAWIRLEDHQWWSAMQAAADAGEHTVVVDVADALHWYSEKWLEWGSWLELFRLAVESARALGDTRLEAMHLGYLVWATNLETGDRVVGLRIARLAVAAAEASGDHQQGGWAHFYLAWMLTRTDLDAGLAACREALVQFELAEDSDGAAQAMIMLSQMLHSSGDDERAIEEYQRVLEHLEVNRSRTHDLVHTITTLSLHQRMCQTFLALGRATDAVRSATTALAAAEAVGSPTRVAEMLRLRATAHLAAGGTDAAAADVVLALGKLDSESTSRYVVSEREQLEALLR
ncbi:helix-turn-helix domain-containing protein [Cellulomonas sp. URHE0023]|uniref:helix-turn-helix domain-containing protein n=1 Tax=Cellulomonas sp. URHE0023 TaxID=1380354 RepID=UPI00068E6E02|nr:helix-turn-helix domain-containing protein [Cellulomonas sp. URHE0023]